LEINSLTNNRIRHAHPDLLADKNIFAATLKEKEIAGQLNN